MSGFDSRRSVAPKTGILDRSLLKPKGEISLSAFAFLFSEIVQYYQNRISSFEDLERKLEDLGYDIGLRLVELVGIKEKAAKRETKIVNMLQYLSSTVWKHLFNKNADNLERSTENEDEYMIHEHSPITNTFLSVPSDMVDHFNGACLIAGMLSGILNSTRFNAKVSAHTVPHQSEGGVPVNRTIFLVKFDAEVMHREKKLM